MICPNCGLLNSPEALQCSCGHALESTNTTETGWPIRLKWSQSVAAYWSIAWPAYVLGAAAWFTLAKLPRDARDFFPFFVFFGGQAFTIKRLVRKNYRSFSVYVLRDDGEQNRNLSFSEAARIWVWILCPQLAVFLIALLAFLLLRLSSESTNSIWGIDGPLRYLVVGPYGVRLALRGQYRRFKLQAVGFAAPTASSSVASTTTTAVRAFSKTIAVTYMGLGLFTLFFLLASFYGLYQSAVSGLPLLLVRSAVLLGLGIGFIFLMMALHQRRSWVRYAALLFWLCCLIWTAVVIVQNGLHPRPAPGPLQYSNAEQLAGARRSALMTPYYLAIVELVAIYCLWRRSNVVNQFQKRGH